jgi:hypothetical protein
MIVKKNISARESYRLIRQLYRMNVGLKMTRVGLAGLAILLGAESVSLAGAEDASPAAPVASAFNDNSNPYSVIIDRNVFRLNPPPSPAEPIKTPPPALPVVLLSGFMRTGDQLKVLLVVRVRNPDPKGSSLDSYLNLAEGDKMAAMSGENEWVVEVVKAYVAQEKVDIINSGTPMTLSMKDNGVTGEAPPPVTAAVGRPTRPTPYQPKLLRRDSSGRPLREPQPTSSPLGAAAAPVDADHPQGNGVIVAGGAALR